MKKRGQATVFIIIGIVILIVIGGIVAVRQGYFENMLEKVGLSKSAPLELKPLQQFMSGCISDVGRNAVNLAALQGGYIKLPSDNIPITPFTPLGSSLEIIPGSDLRSAVWFRERGNGIQELNIPSKDEIENQISNFINENINFCISNLTSFVDQGYDISINDNPKTVTVFNNNRVSFSVNIPMKINKDGTEFSLETFSSSIDSSFGKTFDLAKKIFDAENNQLFFENRTIAMLIAYDDEVPFSGVDFSCSERTWSKSDSIVKLKNILFENVAATGVSGNRNAPKELSYLQLGDVSPPSDVDINFMYIPNWPTVVEINPSKGDLLRGNPVTKKTGSIASTMLASFVCISDHRFIYDIKYPILVTVRGEDGLVFQYVFEVIIDNNQPRINNLEQIDYEDVESPICRYPQKDVAIVTGTLDGDNNVIPLNDVTLMFNCFPATCPLGNSKLNVDGAPILNTKVPLCFNGIVEGVKNGYFKGKTLYSSNTAGSDPILVTLNPLYKKKLNIFVIDKDENSNPRQPYSTEQITIQLVNEDLGYSTYLNYPSDNDKVELLAGDYQVSAYIIRNSTWEITTEKQILNNCFDTRAKGLLGFFKTEQHCETAEIDPMSFDQVLTGGASFKFNFDRKNLADDNAINLYVLSDSIPSNLDDMEKIQMLILTNKDNPKFRYPDFG